MVKPFGVLAENYKAFGTPPQGLDEIHPVTLLIGRNNSGKSSVLDLLEASCGASQKLHKKLRGSGHRGHSPKLWFTKLLGEDDMAGVTEPSGVSLSMQNARNRPRFTQYWSGRRLTWVLPEQGQVELEAAVVPGPEPAGADFHDQIVFKLAKQLRNPLEKHHFSRIAADRDIQPEADGTDEAVVENGQGATNLIQHFANKANRDRALVKGAILRDLNRIFEPDSSFREIVVRQLGDGRWEVFLDEEGKGLVRLSQSGSGLKTILLVLTHLHLVPASANEGRGASVAKYIFGFEELENNLHPALQRRLFSFLRDFAGEHGCSLVLTTHSGVVVDLFADDEHARIVHVTHDGERAVATPVLTHAARCGVLDDLDVRASDLLQANAIVWVEGPSDRVYFNRWVEVWTGGELEEGKDYQCVFYGGSLLAHLSATDPDSVEVREAVEILRVNRNAVVLMDSDKKKQQTPLKPRVKRMKEEVEGVGGYAWVTKGREVEHYVPAGAVAAAFGVADRAPGQYQEYASHLNRLRAGLGRKFEGDKVAFAVRVRPHITREGLEATLDLKLQLEVVCRKIREWNRKPAPAPPVEG